MVSIVVCAYNRAARVATLLENLNTQSPPPKHEVEIIVVDNNSRDATRRVVEGAATRSPYAISYVHERQQGLSFARNRGIGESRGDWIAFLDDDSVPQPGWLRNLFTGLEALGCQVGGGPIYAIWPRRTPPWVARKGRYWFKPMFCHTDHGSASFLFPKGVCDLGGPNMAFHRSIPPALFRFDTSLGKVEGRGEGGEETYLFDRLVREGLRAGYVANAAVCHPIDCRRFWPRHALAYAYWCGYSNGLIEGRRGGQRALRAFAWQCRHLLPEVFDPMLSMNPQGLFWGALRLSALFGDLSGRRVASHVRRERKA
jgi:glycosyltransferase involved in cell wall biosynthesis